MADEETVEQPESVTAEEPEAEQPAADIPLAPDNRPAQNVLGEMQRKYARLEQSQNEILAELRALRNPQPQPQTEPQGEYNDDQLSQLALTGNAQAQRMLIERQVRREADQRFSAWNQEQATRNAVSELMNRYPVLRNPEHPLTQAVYQARNSYIQSGWRPGPQTDLEAIKAAIVTAPHLVPQQPSVNPEVTRRAAVSPQQSVEGSTQRRSPQQPRQGGAPMDKRLLDVAKRMDVKDPAGSLKRFDERQKSGRSAVSPAVQQAVREQENA